MAIRLACSLSIVLLVCTTRTWGNEPADSVLLQNAAKQAAAAEPAPKPAAAEANSAPAAAKDGKAAQPAAAATIPYRKRKLVIKPTLVAVVPQRGGQLGLTVHYRWKLHDNASVEVRLVPGQRAQGTSVVPVSFQSEFCRGPVQLKVYRCLDHAATIETTESFTKDKMVYQIIGRQNSLGRPAVHVLPYNEGGTPAERPGAVFLQLDCWAINDHVLNFDLPRDVFAKSGKLFIWFMRSDRVVWEETIDWPGYKTAHPEGDLPEPEKAKPEEKKKAD